MRLLSVITAALLVSCAPKADLKANPQPASGPSWDQLKGAPFQLESMRVNKEGVKLPVKPRPTVQFADANRVSGHAGVNRYSRTAEIGAGGTIRWTGAAISTRMAGPPELMELENKFLGALTETSRISLTGSTLTLRSADNSAELVLKR